MKIYIPSLYLQSCTKYFAKTKIQTFSLLMAQLVFLRSKIARSHGLYNWYEQILPPGFEPLVAGSLFVKNPLVGKTNLDDKLWLACWKLWILNLESLDLKTFLRGKIFQCYFKDYRFIKKRKHLTRQFCKISVRYDLRWSLLTQFWESFPGKFDVSLEDKRIMSSPGKYKCFFITSKPSGKFYVFYKYL